jgi:hypothetical protein
VRVEDDMDPGPDLLADEGRRPVRDPRQGRRLSGQTNRPVTML